MSDSETSSVSIRSDLVETLRLDLVGPDNTHAFAQEVLPEPPTQMGLPEDKEHV